MAKHLVLILKPIIDNKLMIKNSTKFAKEVMKEDSGIFMSILHVKFLFTATHLEVSTSISCNFLFGNKDKII